VRLTAGSYDLSDHIEIRASGGVLRGDGQSTNGTVLHATGTNRRYDANDPLQDGLVQLKGQIPSGAHLHGSCLGQEFAMARHGGFEASQVIPLRVRNGNGHPSPALAQPQE
jgi:hypothetical protein